MVSSSLLLLLYVFVVTAVDADVVLAVAGVVGVCVLSMVLGD